tara:strand:- start:116 stop:457 length:342 start_codon:yes stop_codon:yes gene_type:complete
MGDMVKLAKLVKQYRQGDVLLVKLDLEKIPDGATREAVDDRVVLAYGEVTGHAHAIDPLCASLYRWQNDRLLEANAGAVLVHEEHSPITLEPGFYRVIQQREYEPGSSRPVID